jgi:hypothetical protein
MWMRGTRDIVKQRAMPAERELRNLAVGSVEAVIAGQMIDRSSHRLHLAGIDTR